MNEANVLNVGRRQRGAVEVAEVVARYRASRLTQERFCRSEGIGLSTLSGYLRRERNGALPPGLVGAPAMARFLEVELESVIRERPGAEAHGSGACDENERAAAGSRAQRDYRVEFGDGLSVEVSGGFVAGELERLIAIVLEATAR